MTLVLFLMIEVSLKNGMTEKYLEGICIQHWVTKV